MNINIEEIEERISKVKSKLLETVSWKDKKGKKEWARKKEPPGNFRAALKEDIIFKLLGIKTILRMLKE